MKKKTQPIAQKKSKKQAIFKSYLEWKENYFPNLNESEKNKQIQSETSSIASRQANENLDNVIQKRRA